MTGSLQDKSGTFYMVINTKCAAGKRKQKWISTHLPIKGNKRKAEQMLTKTLAEYAATGFVEPSKILFCDFVRDWIEINRTKLQVTTYTGYVQLLEKHLYPYFKATGVRLEGITADSIQRYYSAKVAEGLSPNTVIKHHAVIRSTLKYAVKSKLIRENPCDFVERPKTKKFVAEFYNAEEIKQLLEVTKGTAVEVPVFIAAYFGLRRSEVIGCRWSAIDFDSGTLTVRHKVVRALKDGRVQKIASDELKTESSHRVLPLSTRLLEFFAEVKRRQEFNREICGNAYNTEYLDYVCVNGIGELLNPDHVTSAFAKIIKRNGLKRIRLHDLRHSCASLLLALGYSMKEVQEWLGHSDYLTTANLYSHVDPRNKKSMIQGLSSALDGKTQSEKR